MKRAKQWAMERVKAIKKWIYNNIIDTKGGYLVVGMIIAGTATFCYLEIKNNGYFDSKRIVFVNTSQAVVSANASHEKIEGIGESDTLDSPAIQTIKKISQQYDIDWKIVYAVCKVESGCKIPDCNLLKGQCDGNRSMGYYQINKDAHPEITEAQANDLEWSTEWTIKHGLKYKDNPKLFFKNHNGIGKKTNDWYVERVIAVYKSI